MKHKFFAHLLILFIVSMNIQAQNLKSLKETEWTERVQPAPETVFKMFREAGTHPVNHLLTGTEKEKVDRAFAILPPVYKRILSKHLQSISFMDNMPNTALTSLIETTDSIKSFNIVFRAEILNETISKWATWKESTCYKPSESNEFELNIEAGELDAIVYLLLHEATHVVDAVLEITPYFEETDTLAKPTAFTMGIWHKMNVPVKEFNIPLLETTRFRSGKPISISQAPEVYKALQETPFVSLYGMAAWSEDFAEIATIYHLVEKLKQPFRISVKKNNKEVVSFEPLKNKLVKKRLHRLTMFYG